ncbi:gamma-glutamyltransferase [Streptomyces sp. NPDC020681]|uniref:gamma-glutamyltransferase n=1 Tax=Streptomyces sp. NPDC020681 TaxID=3365083 RepID=UPI0037AD3192
MVCTTRKPPVAPRSNRTFWPGLMKASDLADYAVVRRDPTHTTYHGLDVYSMGPSSSGGTAVGEALNILENFHLWSADRAQALHHYVEASRIAFADRNRWVGDPAFSKVPTSALLSKEFAKNRACLIRSEAALSSPLAPPDPRSSTTCCSRGTGSQQPYEGPLTTHLVTADRWGNVHASQSSRPAGPPSLCPDVASAQQ